MARKKIALLHIGPGPAGGGAHEALATHGALLDTVDLVLPDLDEDLALAAHEMLRSHKSAGLKRKQVEGSWSRVVRSTTREKADVVLSLPRLVEADAEQAALVLHELGGFAVHVLTTPTRDDDVPDAPPFPAAWGTHVKASHQHVAPLADDATAEDLAEELVGIALVLQQLRLDTKIAKLKKRRRLVRRRLALRDAS